MNESETNSMDIDYVSNLARIELTDNEKEKFRGQLGDVLKYFQKLQKVDVEELSQQLTHSHDIMYGMRIPLKSLTM